MERYSVLTEDRHIQCLQGCPVLVQALAITKDNQTGRVFIQCKMENMLPQAIAAAYVHFACFGTDGRVLPAVQEQAYLDLAVGQSATFGDGTPAFAPDASTRKVEITLQKVLYADGSVWNNEAQAPFVPYGNDMRTPVASLGELAEQYQRDLGALHPKMAHGKLPHENGSFVHCGCGKIYWKDANTCPSCGVPFSALTALSDNEALQQHLQNYTEEQQRKAAEVQAKEKRAKKKRWVILAVCACCLVVASLFIRPLKMYTNALHEMTGTDVAMVQNAKETFVELGNFMDSAQMVKECDYITAVLLTKGNTTERQEAKALLTELGDYKDAAEILHAFDWIGTWSFTKVVYYNPSREDAKDGRVSTEIDFRNMEIWWDLIEGPEELHIWDYSLVKIEDGKFSITVGESNKVVGEYDSEHDIWQITRFSDEYGESVKRVFTLERSSAS